MSVETNGLSSRDAEQSSMVQDLSEGFASKTWIPHKYQSRGITWLLRPESALFLPPGLGKSSILLAAFLELQKMGFGKRMLLLAPLMVCRTTWETEPQKWRQFQGLKIGLAHGPDKKLILNDPYYDIVVMNYDGLEWAVPMLKEGHNFEVLACDEITRLKNTNSKRYKLIKPVLPSFKFRWGLTGTPTANGLMDLFGQVYVMDLGARLGRFITHFRLKYFHQLPHDQFRYYITAEKSEELTSKLKDLAMYVEPEEWLELPEFMVIPLMVDLSKEARKRYEFLEDEFMLQMKDGVVTAANAGVLTSKLRQFTGGALYTTAPLWEEVDQAKLDKLDDLIEEMAGEPLMVSYQFDHERERILKRHPTALALKGGMSASKVSEVVNAWNDGKASLLLVQPQTAALGLNLQFGGSAICWFTITYNLEEYIQLNKRLHRQGQTKAVRCYLLAASKTIDQRVAKVLAQKDVVQNDVFNALKLNM
jgi:SNF2 family DNA or RNA helicase